jgi:hypothetical protein
MSTAKATLLEVGFRSEPATLMTASPGAALGKAGAVTGAGAFTAGAWLGETAAVWACAPLRPETPIRERTNTNTMRNPATL